MSLPRIGVTLGCPCGIGPEVVAHALKDAALRRRARWILFGPRGAWDAVAPRTLKAPSINIDDIANITTDLALVDSAPGRSFTPGAPDHAADEATAAALQGALAAAKAGLIHAVATGPARKATFALLPGGPYPGHTELFHAHFGTTPAPVMLFVAPGMRLALHTIHVPVSAVPARVTKDRVLATLRTLHQGLTADLRVKHPTIDVLGLNPHASEDGLIGREDLDAVAPAIAAAKAEGIAATGPHPADGYFARYRERPRPGAILALFHDQGLAPFKLWERGRGCQMTVGLSVPRTSCDHGTAYDVAGRGLADPRSMAQALKLALRLAVTRARAGSVPRV